MLYMFAAMVIASFFPVWYFDFSFFPYFVEVVLNHASNHRYLVRSVKSDVMSLILKAEEAQKLRQLRKRMNAESMRLLDMERRQKQRVEEMREVQKKVCTILMFFPISFSPLFVQ